MSRPTLAALVALLGILPSLAPAQTPEEKKATIAYLRTLQSDGGFVVRSPVGDQRPSLRATTLGLRAINYFGGEAKDADACRNFVQGLYEAKTGTFLPDRAPGAKSDTATTAVGIMAIADLKLPLKDYQDAVVKFLGENARGFEEVRVAAAGVEAAGKLPPQAKDWIAQIEAMKNPDGTFGKGDGMARATGSAAVALLRLGAKVDVDNVLKAMRAGQRKDGGFGKAGEAGSDLETTYRVMRAFARLKAPPAEPEALRAFVAKCRNADGGYGVSPGMPSDVGGTYFAAIVLHWLGTK